FGGPVGPVEPPHALPETPPDIVVAMPTRPEQALYYRLNGDDNPLHADPATDPARPVHAGNRRPRAAAHARRLRRRAFPGTGDAVLGPRLSRRDDHGRDL